MESSSSELFGISFFPSGSELYAAIAALCFAFIAMLIVLYATARRKRKDTILLLGLSGSGKTALFYQLRDGSTHQGTVTSMEPNRDSFVLNSELSKKGKIRPVHVVDVPGHPRLRSIVDDYLNQAGGIIFLVDAVDFMPNLRSTTEYLYDVLTKGRVATKKIPVLIVCNKMDKVTAHSMDFIRKQLEKEIDKLRTTRNALSAADITSEVNLGTDGEPFHFTQCINKVSVAEASVLTDRITEVERFIREQIKP